jgi:hypothetical protein
LDFAERGELLDMGAGFHEPLNDFAFNDTCVVLVKMQITREKYELRSYLHQCRLEQQV